MTQLNTPYPATAYLTGFLRQHAGAARARGRPGRRGDRAVPAACSARPGCARDPRRAAARAAETDDAPPASIAHFLAARRARTSTPSRRSCGSSRAATRASRCASSAASCCPRGRGSPRSTQGPGADDDDPLAWAFGGLGIADRAKHLASLYIDDLADVIRDGIDPELRARRATASGWPRARRRSIRCATRSRASRRWSTTCSTRSPRELVARHAPDVVGLTAPFPGNVYGAFRIARAIKARRAGDARSCSAAATSTPSCAS